MTYGTYLKRSRNGTLNFRFVVPKDLRTLVGQTEMSVALGTNSKRTAALVCLELQLEAKRFVDAARKAIRMNDPHARKHALMSLIDRRRADVLLKELHESDALSEERADEIERLRSSLLKTLEDRPRLADITGPLLATAIAAFKSERKATGAWTDKTSEMFDSRLRLLVEWFDNVPVSSLSREQMADFLEALKRLPKNAEKYKKSKGLGMRSQVKLEGMVCISASTVNAIMECVSGLYGWMDSDRGKWKVSGNIAKGLQLSNVRRTKRIPFDANDYRALLSLPEWKAKKFLHSYAYWLIPLASYTGARINELCQIEVENVSDVLGHPVVSLCAEGLRAKNSNAMRTVPIHPELVRLGLLRHVDRLRHAGEKRLFPECIEKRDGYGQDASRWFGKFKRRAGIDDQRKVFHCTRHGFVTGLLNKGLDRATVVAPLVGHAGKGESDKTYWNTKDVKRMVEAVSEISHPIISELVPIVEDVEFGIDVHRLNRRPPPRRPTPVKRTVRRAKRSAAPSTGVAAGAPSQRS